MTSVAWHQLYIQLHTYLFSGAGKVRQGATEEQLSPVLTALVHTECKAVSVLPAATLLSNLMPILGVEVVWDISFKSCSFLTTFLRKGKLSCMLLLTTFSIPTTLEARLAKLQ